MTLQETLAAEGYTPEQVQEVMDSWDQERAAHVVACERRPVMEWRSIIPDRYIEELEQNQLIASCCRHPENHEIEAWYADAKQEAAGTPGIYIFYCNGCGRRHRRVTAGMIDTRPFWEIR